MKNMIEIKNLVKSYDQHQVLKGITFTIQQGEVFALLGTNGAGKTTTLECIENLRKYDSGEIHIHGTIGVQLQSSSLPDDIKVIEALQLFSKWNHTKVDYDVVNSLGLKEILSKRYKQLSTGQKRRMHLALALIGDPEIIILDEPTAGLDVEGRYALHEEMKALKKRGKTLILASHDMAEVEELCDRIAILKDGNIAYCGNPRDLKNVVRDSFEISIKMVNVFDYKKLSHAEFISTSQGYENLQTSSLEDCLEEILILVRKSNNRILDIQVKQATLEQRFIEIAKEE